MKIVGGNKQQVQSLGRHSVGNTGFEGEAKLAGTIGDTLSGLASQMSDIIDNRQQQKADLLMQKEDNDFWNQWGGKDFFDVSELPSEVVTKGMEITGRIPSSEVLPKMYEQFINEQMERASGIIELPGSKSKWIANKQEIALARLTKIQVSANATIEKQIFEDQKLNAQNAIDNGRPDIALQIYNNIDGSESEVKELKQRARQSAEENVYRDMITEGRVKDMKTSLSHLTQSMEKYKSSNGELDPQPRMVWASKLKSELARLDQEKNAVNKYEEERLRRDIGVTQNNALKGMETDPEFLSKLYNRAFTANEKLGGKLTKEILDLQAAIAHAGVVNTNNKFDRTMRQNRINAIPENTPELQQQKRWLQTSHDSQTSLENNDLMKAAREAGAFGPKGVVPINPKLPAEQFAQQIAARHKQFKIVEANYKLTGQGIFEKDEAIQVTSEFNKKTVTDQMKFLTANAMALGGDATIIYQQLTKDGNATSLSIAGLSVLNGQKAGAVNILHGAKYRQENGKEINDIVVMLRDKAENELGNAFLNKPKKRKATVEAIIDGYIGRAVQDGKGLTSVDTGGFFSFATGSEGIFGESLNIATGGLLENQAGGGKFSSPHFGMQQKSWDHWLERLEPDYFDNQGGIQGLQSTDVKNRLSDVGLFAKDYYFVDADKPNTYIIMNEDGVPLAMEKDFDGREAGSVFIFKYDPNAPSMSENEFRASRSSISEAAIEMQLKKAEEAAERLKNK
jgi:hypothetical protein